MAALGCFWHPQIMPDFSLPETCIKPYQNRPRAVMNALFLPTLKPEEPEIVIRVQRARANIYRARMAYLVIIRKQTSCV
jgi:hypothetical protein